MPAESIGPPRSLRHLGTAPMHRRTDARVDESMSDTIVTWDTVTHVVSADFLVLIGSFGQDP